MEHFNNSIFTSEIAANLGIGEPSFNHSDFYSNKISRPVKTEEVKTEGLGVSLPAPTNLEEALKIGHGVIRIDAGNLTESELVRVGLATEPLSLFGPILITGRVAAISSERFFKSLGSVLYRASKLTAIL